MLGADTGRRGRGAGLHGDVIATEREEGGGPVQQSSLVDSTNFVQLRHHVTSVIQTYKPCCANGHEGRRGATPKIVSISDEMA